MNNMLKINMPFNHENSPKNIGARNLNKSRSTSSNLISKLIEDLKRIKKYYDSISNKYIKSYLIDVHYIDIISKSGRVRGVFKSKGESNDYIVGARFDDTSLGRENHIITYYINEDVLNIALERLKEAKDLIDSQLNGNANSFNFDSSNTSIDYLKYKTSKTAIRDVIIDCSAIKAFDIPNAGININFERAIITFFKTELDVNKLFSYLEIENNEYNYYKVGENTYSVSKEVYNLLDNNVPYLISMVSSDLSKVEPQDIIDVSKSNIFIPNPKNEPIIGVIDTLFDKRVYFSEWVDYIEELDEYEKNDIQNFHYSHGTAVTSIIVDGPTLNPNLDDECGRFRVRHFGVCKTRISPTLLIKKIEKIIRENTDICVWNLSLGTEDEVSKNFISFDSAKLDEIQNNYNVIFVVSGTNDRERKTLGSVYKRVGSPADSLNSLVVNSVRFDDSPASYSRTGNVLSFFNKPDVSYYGGDFDERITVCSNNNIEHQYGTSLAAPWISRKLCYLTSVLGFTREVAKALIIDSAAGWKYKQETFKNKNLLGYGVVPKKISSIIKTENSEIKFVVSGVANTYKTTNYGIPVPKDNDKSHYIARATICYFPKCNRLQGVDYTQRELSIQFGRVDAKGIKDINENTQDDDGAYNDERKARKEFRKWENTKFISNTLKDKSKNLKLYNDGMWGLSVVSKERSEIIKKDDLPFGVVVTLKHTQNKNKINEFIHACLLRGYIVDEIKIEEHIMFYEKIQEEIKLE